MTIFYHDINFDIQLMCRCYLRNETLKNALFSCTYNYTGCNKGIFDIIKKRAFFYVCILSIKVLIDTPNFYINVKFIKKCTKLMKLLPNLKLPKIIINGITTRILQYWWKIVLENFSDGLTAVAFHALCVLLVPLRRQVWSSIQRGNALLALGWAAAEHQRRRLSREQTLVRWVRLSSFPRERLKRPTPGKKKDCIKFLKKTSIFLKNEIFENRSDNFR